MRKRRGGHKPMNRVDFRHVCRALILETKALNEARTEYRAAVAGLMGTTPDQLDDWSLDDLERYAELAKEFLRNRENRYFSTIA